MNAAQKILFDLLDVTIDGACEAANAEQFDQAAVQFAECAKLCQQMDLERKEILQEERPQPKQLTIDIPS